MDIANLFSLQGKVALITGIGRGLGRAMGVALASAGADIAGLYSNTFQETQQEVEEIGQRFMPIQCDLSTASTDDLTTVVQRVVDEFGHLDILINNAGIIRRAHALDFSEADWDAVIQVNLKAIFFLSQAAARAMTNNEKGGKIIQIASLLSYQGGITVPSYAAAKHGVAGLTHALANEWASKNINVNAIVPGYFETDNTEALRNNPQRNQAILERIPAGRCGTPEDLMGTAVYLASSASDYVHGTLVPVDGGWLSR